MVQGWLLVLMANQLIKLEILSVALQQAQDNNKMEVKEKLQIRMLKTSTELKMQIQIKHFKILMELWMLQPIRLLRVSMKRKG